MDTNNGTETQNVSEAPKDPVLEAVRELTKAVTEVTKEVKELKAEWAKWRTAGKF